MLEDMRVGYRDGPSDGVKVPDDPLEVLSTWIAEAEEAGSSEPNAMHLATHDDDGPDGRMVLLKHLDSELGFFTNTGSSKALQLASHPSCALTFWWPELERQVRIRGEVRPMPEEQVERYHAARPRESQLSAWTSRQSRPLEERKALLDRRAEAERRFEGELIPVPTEWGGYLVRPRTVELWWGRPGRLHDRLRFTLEGETWTSARLEP